MDVCGIEPLQRQYSQTSEDPESWPDSNGRYRSRSSSPCAGTFRCGLCECRLSKQRVDPAASRPRSASATRSLAKGAAVAMVMNAVEKIAEAALVLLTMTKTWAAVDGP